MAGWHGLLVFDKPSGPTSRAVVDRAQEWFPSGTRLGHTGTLDPLASGVLVLCVGLATRLAEYVQRMAKTYHAGLLLGSRSTTDDLDGTVEVVAGAQPPERAPLSACLSEFLGEIEQVPPAHSAAHVSGRRAYELARRGQAVELPARRVRIDALEVLLYDYPRLELRVHCGKGTYIRSLARDLGARLGCGALVETLRRSRVGPFTTEHALSMATDAATARAALLPLSAAVAELPRVTLASADVHRLRQGQMVSTAGIGPGTEGGSTASEVAVFDAAGNLAAIAVLDPTQSRLRPEKVFALSE